MRQARMTWAYAEHLVRLVRLGAAKDGTRDKWAVRITYPRVGVVVRTGGGSYQEASVCRRRMLEVLMNEGNSMS